MYQSKSWLGLHPSLILGLSTSVRLKKLWLSLSRGVWNVLTEDWRKENEISFVSVRSHSLEA